MATSTLLSQIIANQSILPSLISGVVAAGVALGGQYYFFWKNQNEERYRKLYGPLTYNLLMMRLITTNREELTKEILETWVNVEMKNNEMIKHLNPLVKQWLEHKDNILNLLEMHPGYIKKGDIRLVEDFLDGCVKRKIIEDGKNWYASEERINQLLNAVKALQERLVPTRRPT